MRISTTPKTFPLASTPEKIMWGLDPVPGGDGGLRHVAAERAGDDLDPARERVVAIPERRRVPRLEDRALLDSDLEQVVEAFVEQDLGIEDHDQVGSDHHLHHPFVEVEVDRARGLRRRPAEVEHRFARPRARPSA